MANRIDITIGKLLESCEMLSKNEANYGILKENIELLDTMVAKLKEYDDGTKKSNIRSYFIRLQALKETTANIKSSLQENETSFFKQTGNETSKDAAKEIQRFSGFEEYANLQNSNTLRLRRTKKYHWAALVNMSSPQADVEKNAEQELKLKNNLEERAEAFCLKKVV